MVHGSARLGGADRPRRGGGHARTGAELLQRRPGRHAAASPAATRSAEWIASDFNSGGNDDSVTGNFRWIDYTPNAGGNVEIRDQLGRQRGAVCGIRVGDNVVPSRARSRARKSAWNTRFGIYPNGANAYTASNAPPDRTGYAYPNKAPGNPVIRGSTPARYDDYRSRQGANTGFLGNQYGVSGPGGNFNGNPSPAVDHQQRRHQPPARGGTDHRLRRTQRRQPITGHGLRADAEPDVQRRQPARSTSSTVGSRRTAGSPCCQTGGFAGGPAARGPQVPTLVQ